MDARAAKQPVVRLESDIDCLITKDRIGKEEVKGCEAVKYTLEFFISYPYNVKAIYG